MMFGSMGEKEKFCFSFTSPSTLSKITSLCSGFACSSHLTLAATKEQGEAVTEQRFVAPRVVQGKEAEAPG